MNQREKVLAGLVGTLLAVFLVWLLVGQVRGALNAKRLQIAGLKKSLQDKEKTLADSHAAKRRMKTYEARSLPSDAETAPREYGSWLRKTLESAGVEVDQISPGASTTRDNDFRKFQFTAKASGDLAQLTKALHKFYSADHLHRIQTLSIRPIRDGKDDEKKKKHDLKLIVEALSLPKADRVDSLSGASSDRLAMASVDDYLKSIVGRNLFSPANRQPKLEVPRSQEGNPGKSLSFQVEGSDPDKLDILSFELVGAAPPGARLDRSSGRFEWTPKDKGEFVVRIAAVDNGLPAQRVERDVTLVVVEPKPEPPPPPPPPPMKPKLEFDSAKHAFVTAIVEDGQGRAETWVSIRTTGEILKLRVGDKLDVGSVQGKIQRIGAGEVEIKTGDKTVAIRIGENLLETVAPLDEAN